MVHISNGVKVIIYHGDDKQIKSAVNALAINSKICG